MADRTVKVTLRADTGAFTSGMRQAAAATKEVADESQKAATSTADSGKNAEKGAAGHKKAADAAKEAAKSQQEAGEKAAAAGEKTKGAGDKARESAAGFSQLAEKARTNAAEMQTIGVTMTAAGAAMTAFAAAAVSVAADFDAAMSSVAAATHAPAQELQALRDAAIDAGAKTAFSATEAAAGIEELAKAGVSTKDILGGGLSGALDLAAAGSIGVGEAAETAASALTQFKLSGSDVGHVADLLAAGAGKAQGGVSDMGQALGQAGLIASQTGLTIEETVGALAAFASAGLVGSDAGTSFKTMLQRLSNPSKEARQLMDELGISMYDAQGHFVGTEALAGQLKTALSGLTQEQRNAALATIFGSDSIRAAAVFAEQGAEGIAAWTAAVNDTGYASETAALMMDNLKGDLEEFGGAWETLLIKMGSGGQGPLRSLVQSLTEVVRWFTDLPGPVQQSVLAIAGIGGAALTAGGAFLYMLPHLLEVKAAMDTLGINAQSAKDKVTGFFTSTSKGARAARGLAAALVALEISSIGRDSLSAGRNVDLLTTSLKNLGKEGSSWRDAFQTADTSGVKDLTADLERLSDPNLWDSINNGVNTFSEGITAFFGFDTGDWTQFKNDLQDIDTALSGMDFSEAQAAFQNLAQGTDGSEKALKNLLEALPQFKTALTQQAQAMGLATDDATLLKLAMGEIADTTEQAATSGPLFRESLTGIADEAASSAEALEQLTSALTEYYGAILDLRGSNRDLEAAIDAASEAIAENGNTLDVTTEAGRENEAALDGIASSAWALVESQQASGASADEMAGTLQRARDALIGQLEAMGWTREEASAYADELGLIPEDITTTIQAHTAQAFESLTEFTASVDAATGTVTINGNDYNGRATLGELVGNIDESDGTVTINGNKYPADQTLFEYLGIVDNSDGTVSINGNSAPGQATLNGLKVAIDRTTGKVTINGDDKASGVAIRAVQKMPKSHTITITQVFQTIGRVLTSGGNGRRPNSHATGGAVYGPGTGTSDDVPAWLSNGEHVLTAREVSQLGGQSAAYRLRSLIRSGLLRDSLAAGGVRLATGGSPSQPNVAPPSVSIISSRGAAPTANVTIQMDNPITGEQIRHVAESVADGQIVRWRRSVG